jgi:hypothetical protein
MGAAETKNTPVTWLKSVMDAAVTQMLGPVPGLLFAAFPGFCWIVVGAAVV